jgi:hypothetical protein
LITIKYAKLLKVQQAPKGHAGRTHRAAISEESMLHRKGSGFVFGVRSHQGLLGPFDRNQRDEDEKE